MPDRSLPTLPILLFDLDGTLVRFGWDQPALQQPRQRLLALAAELGVSAPPGMLFPALILKGRERPEVLEAIADLEAQAAAHATPCAAVHHVLAQLCDKSPLAGTLALVTNNGAHAAHTALQRAGIAADAFAAAVCREHVRNPKPDPEALRHALQLISSTRPQALPLQVVVVGDAVTDVQAARALRAAPPQPLQLHMIAVATGVSSAAALQESGADVVLSSLEALPAALGALAARPRNPAQ